MVAFLPCLFSFVAIISGDSKQQRGRTLEVVKVGRSVFFTVVPATPITATTDLGPHQRLGIPAEEGVEEHRPPERPICGQSIWHRTPWKLYLLDRNFQHMKLTAPTEYVAIPSEEPQATWAVRP
ncbi:hypothetical protein LZ30DRAFT_724132 [Colletotrichum cereale]|nr:hypothetical protein LZ30DRAFT_724132 [Colletotrichum cereale]